MKQIEARAMLTRIAIGFAITFGLTACWKPQLTERPVLDALTPPVEKLGRAVAVRDWSGTTSATRDIVAIMDKAE